MGEFGRVRQHQEDVEEPATGQRIALCPIVDRRMEGSHGKH